jgi:hypothetical protein
MMPSGLISMSRGSSGCISTAAVSGLNGVVERPWKEDDQSIAWLAPLPLPLELPLRAAVNADEGTVLVGSVVGIWAARAGSTSATVADWGMAACGSRTVLGLVGAGVGAGDFVAAVARARDAIEGEGAARGLAV